VPNSCHTPGVVQAGCFKQNSPIIIVITIIGAILAKPVIQQVENHIPVKDTG